MGTSLLDDIMATAESFTNNFSDKGHFDYSVESLHGVEHILEEVCDYELDEDTLNSVSSMVGCYIFEVARRNFGGKYYWMEEKEQPVLVTGEPSFSVSIYAFDKVKGRLVNGKEDHIPFYFEGYIKAVENGRNTGTCSVVV